MCTVADDDYEGEKYMESQPTPQITPDTNCNKCKTTQAVIILRKKDLYCNECFLAGINHKFRANFGKTKLVKPNENVLIAHSGDAESSALLYLVNSGLEETTYRKLRFNPKVIHIDESVINNVSSIEREESTNKIISQVEPYKNLPLYVASLSDIMDVEDLTEVHQSKLIIRDGADDKLKNLYRSVDSLTAKQDLLRKLRRNLLIKYAKILKCSFILSADTATKLAADSLINISLGGGLHMASDIGFSDDRDDVKILRPMRDFTSEELKIFMNIKQIPYIPQKSTTDCENQYASIQLRIKHFIEELQQNFPATVSTVLRTSNKMENLNSGNENDQCVFCQSVLDNQMAECSALQATVFSKEMSGIARLNENLQKNCSVTESEDKATCSDCSCSTNKNKLTSEAMSPFLCYRCQIIVKDTKDANTFPSYVLSNVLEKNDRQNMKNMIQDFLL